MEGERKMTEQQFTPEYIALMQSDEAKALQEQHPVLSFGDRVWILGDASVGIVKQVWTSSSRSIRASYDVMAPDLGGPTIFEGLREDFAWLPTLSQLIGVIEGRWPRVEMGSYLLYGVRHHWMRGLGMPPKTSVGRPIVRETDIMLAAAQLAVRAVEEK